MAKALIFLIILASVARAETKTIEADWLCPQTFQTSVPLRVSVKISVDEAGNIDLSEFNKIIASANSHPQLDFFTCMISFSNKAHRLIEKNFTEKELAIKLNRKIDGAVYEYATAAYDRFSVSAFEPGKISLFKPKADEKRFMEATIVQYCGIFLNPYVPAEMFLDATFIGEQLPKLTDKIRIDTAAGKRSDGEKCLKQIAGKYLNLLYQSALPADHCQKAPEKCQKRQAQIQKTIGMLTKIKELAPILSEKWKALGECCSSTPDFINQKLYEWVNEFKQISPCVVLNEKQVSAISGDMGAGGEIHYTLRRLKNQPGGAAQYQAILNFRFELEIPEAGHNAEEFHKKYSGLIRKCFNEANQQLHGQRKGDEVEKLELVLFDDIESQSKVPASQKRLITVVPNLPRPDMNNWPDSADCASVLHETLHYLGLVDEYQENQSGYTVAADGSVSFVSMNAGRKAYDCRVQSPDDSMMNLSDYAYKSAFYSGFKMQSCVCWHLKGRAVEQCVNEIQKIRPPATSCPGKSKLIKDEYSASDLSQYPKRKAQFDEFQKQYLRAEQGEEMKAYIKQVPINVEEIKPHSLLYPAQFRVITQPGCTSVNKTYYRCAQESTLTSRTLREKSNCRIGLPEVCVNGKDGRWLQ